MHLCNWISKFVAYGVRDNNLKKFAMVQIFVTYNFYFSINLMINIFLTTCKPYKPGSSKINSH
jgi:hypothetical protein